MKGGELGRIFADGEIIFEENSKGDTMYVVQAGKVRIEKETPYGKTTFAILKDGDIFGEMALFDQKQRSATAVAEGEARVLSIDKSKLFSSISHDPTLLFKIIETMSRRIRSLNKELAQYTQKD